MGTIPQELKKFKESLDGKVDGIKSALSNLQSKLSSMINSNNTAKNGIDSNYQSVNKSTLLNSFSSMNSNLDAIISSFSAVNSLLESVTALIGEVSKLETLNTEHEELEGMLSAAKAKAKDEDSSALSEIKGLEEKITKNEKDFEEAKAHALSKLSELKSSDISIEVSGSTATSSATTKLPTNVGFGEFIREKFTASNGISIDYLLYVPDYGDEVVKPALNMYMHGSGTEQNNFSRLQESGLGKEIIEGNILPTGMLLMPLAPTGQSYNSKDFRDALAELPLKVAEEYNCDKNRISLSGHSWGAITAYDLVNEHPDEFSAIVTASGSDKVTSAFLNTKVWAFHGSNDERKESRTAYSKAVEAIEEIKRLGGDAELYTYEGVGHSLAAMMAAFTNEYERDGELINPLEWAFQQTKA